MTILPRPGIDGRLRGNRRLLARGRPLALAVILLAAGSAGRPEATTQATAPADLLVRVGLTTEEADRARGGQAVVRVLASNADTEVAVAGAIRIRGDLERLVVWLRDVESFRKAVGTEAVGVIGRPARPEDFAEVFSAGVDLEELRRCRPGNCDIRMPATFLSRFTTEVPWGTPQAAVAANALARQMLAEYSAAYQNRGDAGLGAHHDSQAPQAIAAEFQDMLRRATPLWNLAYPFASYLETFPAGQPPGVEDRFYWTRESGPRQLVTTLHHLVLQRLADRSLRLADKQFYASREFDTGLLVGQATPSLDGSTFDLVVSLRARSGRLGSVAARVLRGRIEREVADSLALYLDWLRRNFALG
jgi:hypothetical protein